MAAPFRGFSPKALSFFRQLERNNCRDWFQPRKDLFEIEVRGPMIELVEQINDDLRSFAADYVSEPKKAIYRFYRDTRFSKDKSPYKTHIAATFSRRGLRKNSAAGMYFSVSHKEVEVAAGVYMPEPEVLTAIRDAMVAQPDVLPKLVNDRALRRALGELQGEKFARVPRAYENAARKRPQIAEFLKHKQLYVYVTLDPKVATTSKLRREVVNRFRAAAPMVEFFNSAAMRARTLTDDEPARPVRPAPMF
jgi:uncharacterized protein (TIGR02453 family)